METSEVELKKRVRLIRGYGHRIIAGLSESEYSFFV